MRRMNVDEVGFGWMILWFGGRDEGRGSCSEPGDKPTSLREGPRLASAIWASSSEIFHNVPRRRGSFHRSSVSYRDCVTSAVSAPAVATACAAIAVAFGRARCKAKMSGTESECSGGGSGTTTSSHADLLVVGPGVLGSLVGRRWLELHKGCRVVGQTNTTNRHEELLSLGIFPVTKENHSGDKFPYVIFCAPPSGSEDYPAEVRAAAQRWNGEGSLLFTSSSFVYNVHDNGHCHESTPTIEKETSPRVDRLLYAEEEVSKVDGNVVRLAGLYARDRGAHRYWLQKGEVDARPDHFLNLIHYEDAADLCIEIMRKKLRGQIFMGCDNTPVSRQDIMDIMLHSGKFAGDFHGFSKRDGLLGKKMNNSQTRERLRWQPKYNSFKDYISTL